MQANTVTLDVDAIVLNPPLAVVRAAEATQGIYATAPLDKKNAKPVIV